MRSDINKLLDNIRRATLNPKCGCSTALIALLTESYRHSTCRHIYVIDISSNAIIYLSDRVHPVLKYKCASKSIHEFLTEILPNDDLVMLYKFDEKVKNLLESIPITKRKSYTFSCDLHLKELNRSNLAHHTFTPLQLQNNDRETTLVICTISLADTNTTGNARLKFHNDNRYFKYQIHTNKWIQYNEIELSETERDILILSTQGYTMADISDLICRSIDTVKSCKRSIFKKMGVKNIAQALIYAQNNQLI